MTDELKFTGNIRRLRLKPGDTIVVELPAGSTQEQAAHLLGGLRHKFPDNEIVLLAGGVRISAVVTAPKVSIARLNGNTAGLLG